MDAQTEVNTAEIEAKDKSNMDQKMIYTCRICLIDYTATQDFLDRDELISLFDKTMSIANVKISTDDGLPNRICSNCAKKLEIAYSFKLQIEQADTILRQKSDIKEQEVKSDCCNVKQRNLEEDCDDENQSSIIYVSKLINSDAKSVRLKNSGFEEPAQILMSEHDYISEFEGASAKESVSPIKKKDSKPISQNVKSLKKPIDEEEIKEDGNSYKQVINEESYFENLNLSSRLKESKSAIHKPQQIFFVCYLCDDQFGSKELLKTHMSFHDEIKNMALISKVCDKSVDKSPNSGKCQNKCPYCEKEYLYVNSYTKHIKQCQRERDEQKEPLMPLEVTFQENDDSLEFDEDENIFYDSEMGEVENSEEVIDEAEASEKQKTVEQNICKLCDRHFSNKIALKKHLSLHEKQKSFKCTQCNKSYGNELTLRNHLIATNHKTIIYGKEYDPYKRITRVATKAAQETVSEQIKTDSSDSDDNSDPDYKDEEEEEEEMKEVVESESEENPKPLMNDFVCGICALKFTSKSLLMKHAEVHISDNKEPKQEFEGNQCKEDDDGFSGGFDWPLDIHECLVCKKRYSTKKSLLRHQLLHKDPNYECDICNVKFYRKDKLKVHYDRCSERNPDQVRKCNICGDSFASNDILKEHKANHVTEGILTEEDLREIEPSSQNTKTDTRKVPRKRRTDITGLECVDCNKQYSSRKGLLRHLQTHEGKKYLCDMCPKKFTRKEHLKIHVARHNIIKPFKCNRCSKRFIKEDQLNLHLLKHDRVIKKPKDPEAQKRFLCEICSKSFTQSTTLVAHLRAHNGIKPYTCGVCSRPFTTNAYLKMHMRTHTQEKPYICQYCSRAFARADTLSNHLTSHTGEAKYHCKYCPKNFRRLKSLKEHVFIHTGQRPYSCPTCDRKFNNNGSRYAHSKRCKQQIERRDRLSKIMVGEPVKELEVEPKMISDNNQLAKPSNMKTIMYMRPTEQLGQTQIVSQQEILMPLILPVTVTLSKEDEKMPSECKIFTL